MELRGRIVAILPLQSGEGRNGIWRKQEYVLEHNTESQYPRRMAFNLWGERIDQFKLQEGQWVKVDFDIDCREFQGRWYNDIRAWRIENITDNAAAPAASPQPEMSEMPPMPPAPSAPFGAEDALAPGNDSSDLPF